MNHSLIKAKHKNHNKEKVLNAITEMMKTNGNVIPSHAQIAEYCGLTRMTIYNLFKDLDTQELVDQYKVYVPKLTETLLKQGIEGNVSASKLFLQVTNNLVEKTETKVDAKIDQRIQIQFVDENTPQEIINNATDIPFEEINEPLEQEETENE